MKKFASQTILLLVAFSSMVLTAGPAGAATAPTLGTAGSFAVLGATTVTNTGPTVIEGGLGVSPGTAVTGFPPGTSNPATIHSADAVAGQAQTDTTLAYNNLAGQQCDDDLTGQDLGTLPEPLVPGTYCFDEAALLTGALVLNTQGNPDSVFIFQIGSTLTTASNSSVTFVNGVSCNVYWQIGSSATLGTGTDFQGSILAVASITANTGATVDGRLLAQNGAVTMDSNTVTRPSCGTPVEDESPTLTPTPSPSPASNSTSDTSSTSSSTPSPAATSTTAAPVVVGPGTVIPVGTVISPDQIVISAAPGASLTTTSVPTSSTNPSEVGQSIDLTVTVTPIGSGLPVPTGMVTFISDSTSLGTVPLNSRGVATLTTSSLSRGDHKITAVYHGGANFAGSISRSLIQTVTSDGSAVTITTARGELVKTGINALPIGFTGGSLLLLGATLLLEDRRRPKKALVSGR
jgi:hypothetical protein